MESGHDVGGILAYMKAISTSHITVSQWPTLDLLTRKNPFYMLLQRKGWFNPRPNQGVPFAMKHQAQRRKQREEKKVVGDAEAQILTDKFLIAQEDNPNIMGPNEVLAMALSIIAAGSDTTAISLAALFYYLLKNPDCLRKLQEEADAAFTAGPNTKVGDYATIKFARA